MLHLRENQQNILGGEEEIVSTLPCFSLDAQQLHNAGVLLCNVQRQFRIWMCMQCLHKSTHSNNNRCLVYMVKWKKYQNIKTVSKDQNSIYTKYNSLS